MKSLNQSEQSATKLKAHSANQSGTVMLFGEVLADVFPDRTVLGGAPFNVARHLKAFDQNPVLITRLGKDNLCDDVLQAMAQYGMDTTGIQIDDANPTGQVMVHIDGTSHRFEILPLQAYDFIHPIELDGDTLPIHPALVYFGTLAQRHEVSRLALDTLLDTTPDAEKFMDINLRVPWYNESILHKSLQYANIVKLNDDELGILAKLFTLVGSNPEDQIMDLLTRFNVEQAIITCGENGAWQINRSGEIIKTVPKEKTVKLLDTVGAGDGFAAIYILGSLLQWPIKTTLARANTFASSICEIRGAIPEHADFYKPFIQEWKI
jgi:fructokinase